MIQFSKFVLFQRIFNNNKNTLSNIIFIGRTSKNVSLFLFVHLIFDYMEILIQDNYIQAYY